jgi:hypothetical protein
VIAPGAALLVGAEQPITAKQRITLRMTKNGLSIFSLLSVGFSYNNSAKKL